MAFRVSRRLLGLDEFKRHYVLAALWSDILDLEDADRLLYWLSRIIPGTYIRMLEDCDQFLARHGWSWSEDRVADAGLSFWLSRNRAVGGFAEADWGESGPALDAAARELGPFHLGVDGEGRVVAVEESEPWA